MIGCDSNFKGCREWYHVECVDIDQDKPLPAIWVCKNCLEITRKKNEKIKLREEKKKKKKKEELKKLKKLERERIKEEKKNKNYY